MRARKQQYEYPVAMVVALSTTQVQVYVDAVFPTGGWSMTLVHDGKPRTVAMLRNAEKNDRLISVVVEDDETFGLSVLKRVRYVKSNKH